MKRTINDYPRTLEAIKEFEPINKNLAEHLKLTLIDYLNNPEKPYQTLFTAANMLGGASTFNTLQTVFDYEHEMITKALEDMRQELHVSQEINP